MSQNAKKAHECKPASISTQVVDLLIRQGFYVNIDFHSIGFHKTLDTGETPFTGADDYSLYDIDGWTNLW